MRICAPTFDSAPPTPSQTAPPPRPKRRIVASTRLFAAAVQDVARTAAASPRGGVERRLPGAVAKDIDEDVARIAASVLVVPMAAGDAGRAVAEQRRREEEQFSKDLEKARDDAIQFLVAKLDSLKVAAEDEAARREQVRVQEAKAKADLKAREERDEKKRVEDKRRLEEERLARIQLQQQQQEQLQQQQQQQQIPPPSPAAPIPVAAPAPPATAPAPASTAAPKPPRQSTVPTNVVTSEEAWDTASKFISLVKDIKTNVRPQINTRTFPTSMKERMKINQAVGQVTQSRDQMLHV
ncbi:hypothetical protein HDU98_002147, partial [Podochytrium sp. JEL0797]